MAKAEIHIVKDEIGMTTEISGSLMDAIQLFGQAIEICSEKYDIDLKKLCVSITKLAAAYQAVRNRLSDYFAEKINSEDMSELVTLMLKEAHENNCKKHIEEQANDE